MQREETTIEGQIAALIYKNDESGYVVARALLDDGEEITIVGTMPFLGVGEYISATGEHINHPKHGEQFQVSAYSRTMPDTEEGIYEYLASHTIKGIGSKTARAIVDAFGERSFDVIAGEPEKLTFIKGISPARAKEISQCFLQLNTMRMIMDFLTHYDLPPFLAATLFRIYGNSTIDTLRKNPYILCEKDYGVDFFDVDKIAFDFGIDKEDDVRVSAGILYELYFNAENGHAFIPVDKLVAATAQLCEAEEEAIYICLEQLLERERVVCDDVNGLDCCYLWELFSCETFIAREVNRLSEMTLVPPKSLAKDISRIEGEIEMAYGEGQKEAIGMCFHSAISLITGGPGTGKTTTLLGLLKLLEKNGMSFLLSAPTGRAAKRMSELCGKEAKTLHRMLEAGFDVATGRPGFKRNRNNPLKADIVIVDEASMIDLMLAAALLDALEPHTRLVLIGDADQLPPMGPGHFFADLIASPTISKTCLSEIFRQAQGSDIVVNAHKINNGVLPHLRKNDGDFFFATAQSADTVASSVVALITERIPQRFGIPPEEVQVICPSRQLACGTASLNMLLQQSLNPPSPMQHEVKYGNIAFRIGDRVMQIKNNYDMIWQRVDQPEIGTGVFNGDTGVITYIDPALRILVVRYDDREAEYGFDELNQLEHAYAITVHKAQGSEYQAVIIPAFTAPQRLLNRCLLYTAVTRARKLLVIVGREDTVQKMIESNNKNRRYSALRLRIAEGRYERQDS